MIRIEANTMIQKGDTLDIILSYEQDENVVIGEYLAILDKIKNEIIDNALLSEIEVKRILFEEQ